MNVDGRGGAAYLKYSVVREGCCHDGSRAEDDKGSEEGLSFVEHDDEVERKEGELEGRIDQRFCGCLSRRFNVQLLLGQLFRRSGSGLVFDRRSVDTSRLVR